MYSVLPQGQAIIIWFNFEIARFLMTVTLPMRVIMIIKLNIQVRNLNIRVSNLNFPVSNWNIQANNLNIVANLLECAN